MDELLHHLRTMGNHCLLVSTGESFQGGLRRCRISSIHSIAFHGTTNSILRVTPFVQGAREDEGLSLSTSGAPEEWLGSKKPNKKQPWPGTPQRYSSVPKMGEHLNMAGVLLGSLLFEDMEVKATAGLNLSFHAVP